MDGSHSIEKTAEVTEIVQVRDHILWTAEDLRWWFLRIVWAWCDVQNAVYKAIREQNLLLEGTLLKPNMVSLCPRCSS